MSEKLEQKANELRAKIKQLQGKLSIIEAKLENPKLVRKVSVKSTQKAQKTENPTLEMELKTTEKPAKSSVLDFIV